LKKNPSRRISEGSKATTFEQQQGTSTRKCKLKLIEQIRKEMDKIGRYIWLLNAEIEREIKIPKVSKSKIHIDGKSFPKTINNFVIQKDSVIIDSNYSEAYSKVTHHNVF
jgi:trans-2-enoyl-CoA reductase